MEDGGEGLYTCTELTWVNRALSLIASSVRFVSEFNFISSLSANISASICVTLPIVRIKARSLEFSRTDHV